VRVLLDTTYARRAPYSGTGIYIQRLCSELSRDGRVEVVEASNRRRRAPAGGGIGSMRNLGADLWWSGVELPRQARRAGAQLIHHPLPARAPVAGLPQVITVVDLAFERMPDAFDRGYRTYAHVTHRVAASRACAVIAVSETTAADARELWAVPGDRIIVAHLGPGQELEARARPVRPAHFLYVGDQEPRKNLPALLEAYGCYRRLVAEPLELLLAGSADARGPGIRVVLRPRPERLAELYAGAAALVHPSLYEGFGLTTLEAMRLGIPVLAAPSAGVVEVCGDAAQYVDPAAPQAMAAAMLDVGHEQRVQERLRARGLERAGEFSWARCARLHVEAYSLALGE
jgi:glycosyltransferase involved in cell wall biosynthesis